MYTSPTIPLQKSFATVLVLLFFLTAVGEVLAATNVGGSISSNTTWTAAGSPYRVTSSVTIEPGIALTIEAGVRVEFSHYTGLYVPGILEVFGNAIDPVVFAGSDEVKNWWRGIQIYGD